MASAGTLPCRCVVTLLFTVSDSATALWVVTVQARLLVASVLAGSPEHSSQGCNPCSWPAMTACQTFILLQFMIYMGTIFFLSFSAARLLFFFKNTCKGYIFLCNHNFYFSAGKNLKVTELKFFMLFKNKERCMCTQQHPCENKAAALRMP